MTEIVMMNWGAPKPTPKALQEMRRYGVTTMVFGLNKHGGDARRFVVEPRPLSKLRPLCRAWRAGGFKVLLMPWMRANAEFIRGFNETIIPELLADDPLADGVCFNTEGEWAHDTRDHAGLVESAIINTWRDVPVALHCVAMPHGRESDKRLLRYVTQERGAFNGYGFAEAYSFLRGAGRGRPGTPEDRAAFGEPDRFVTFAQKRFAPVVGDRFVPVLDVYGEEYPGWSYEGAMNAALDQVTTLQTPALAIWAYGSLWDLSTGKPINSYGSGGEQAGVRRRCLLDFVERGGRVSSAGRRLAQEERAGLAGASRQAGAVRKLERRLQAPKHDVQALVDGHAFEAVPTTGRLYNFNSRRWV